MGEVPDVAALRTSQQARKERNHRHGFGTKEQDDVLALCDLIDNLRAEAVADHMRRNGWTENEIGAAMDGRYAGTEMDRRG